MAISTKFGGTGQTSTGSSFNALAPTTTKGDLIVHDASTNTRLAAGTDGLFLKADSSVSAGLTYASPVTTVATRSVTTTDTATTSDDTLVLSGASFTETIFTAVGNSGKRLTLIHNGTSLSQIYTLNTTSGQTIGGIASGVYKLNTNGEVLVIQSDGSNWLILEHKTDTGWIDAGVYIPTYTFTITSGSATLGATYTHNGNTYTVAKTIASQTTLITRGNGAPLSSGTLTKSTGTGDATLTFSSVTGATYNMTATTTAPILHGDASTSLKWRRKADRMTFWVKISWPTAGTAGSGDYIFPLALSNVAFDTSIHPTETGGTAQSSAQVYTANSAFLNKMIPSLGGWQLTAGNYTWQNTNSIMPYSSTSFRFYLGQYAGGGPMIPFGSTYGSFGNGDTYLTMQFEFTVSGWQP